MNGNNEDSVDKLKNKKKKISYITVSYVISIGRECRIIPRNKTMHNAKKRHSTPMVIGHLYQVNYKILI